MIESIVISILVLPLLASLVTALTRKLKVGEVTTVATATILLALSILVSFSAVGKPQLLAGGELILDALSALFLTVISLIYFAVAIYSPAYIGHEIAAGALTSGRGVLYYALVNVFVFTMLLTVLTNNIVIAWIALEATTIASAHLVALMGTEETIEAAWKYVILCSVGIAFALYGVVTIYYVAQGSGIEAPFLWTSLVENAGKIPSSQTAILKLAFVLLILGFGTKAGLAPLHTWLPDAYYSAPAPVSALFSGVLEECAMYLVMRFFVFAVSAGLGPLAQAVLLMLGLLSMAISSLHMLVATDFKRLLAFSTVEHMGIVACSLGFGGLYGAMAAVMMILFHALAKASLFLLSGVVMLSQGTLRIPEVRGLLRSYPALGGLFFSGVYAIIGGPPFGTFLAELLAITAGLSSPALLVVFIVFLVIAFAAMLVRGTSMVLGEPKFGTKEVRGTMLVSPLLLLLLLLALGVYQPYPLSEIFRVSSELLGGAP